MFVDKIALPHQTRDVTIPGMREAVVVECAGREVGTVARPAPDAAWTVYRGVGAEAAHVGNRYDRAEAVRLCLGVPSRREWKVFGVSSNANGFGLRGMLMVSRNGKVWRVLANDLNIRRGGNVIVNDPAASGWAGFGFECPEPMPDAPPAVVRAVWG